MRDGFYTLIQTTFHVGQSLWNQLSDAFYTVFESKERSLLDFPSDIDYEQRDYCERDFEVVLENLLEDIKARLKPENIFEVLSKMLLSPNDLSPAIYVYKINALKNNLNSNDFRAYAKHLNYWQEQTYQKLLKDSELALTHFRADVLDGLLKITEEVSDLKKLKKQLSFYQQLIDDTLYEKTIDLLTSSNEDMQHKIDQCAKLLKPKEQQLTQSIPQEVKKEINAIVEQKPTQEQKPSFLNTASKKFWSLLTYINKHPKEAFVLGLAYQATAAAAWQSFNSKPTATQEKMFNDNNQRALIERNPIGGEFRVNTYTTSHQSAPSVTVLTGGDFIVTWHSDGQDGNGEGIYAQRYNSIGQSIGIEFQVNTYTTNSQGHPSVTALMDGGFVVAWESDLQDGSNKGIYAQLYDNSSAPVNTEIRVNTYTTNSQISPSVAGLGSEGFVVTWSSRDQTGEYDVYGQCYGNTGIPILTEFRVNTYTTSTQHEASVAGFATGGFVVVWRSVGQDGEQGSIQGQRYASGCLSTGSEFQVNTYTTKNQAQPSVAAFIGGGFIVTWDSEDQDGSDDGIYAQHYDIAGITVDSEFQVNTYTSSFQSSSSVVTINNGGFIIVWNGDQDGNSYGIYNRRYNSTGGAVGSEIQVNTYTTNLQSEPSVAVLSEEAFVVAWDSYGQDGNGWGIYGQRYDASVITTGTTGTTGTTATTATTGTTGTTEIQTSGTTSIPLTTGTTATTATTGSTAVPPTSTASQITTAPVIGTTGLLTSSSSTGINVVPTTPETDTEFSTSSNPEDNTFVWVLLIGIGGGSALCLLLGVGGYVWYRKKYQNAADTRESDIEGSTTKSLEKKATTVELTALPKTSDKKAEEDSSFRIKKRTVSKKMQTREKVGSYFLMDTITRNEALQIRLETGLIIDFDMDEEEKPFLLGRGSFGNIGIAFHREHGFVAYKKVTGEDQIKASQREADLQYSVSDLDYVLKIYNTLEESDALYHFMQLAGYGNGRDIQRLLQNLNDTSIKMRVLELIAHDLLEGIHNLGTLCHLDLKPENLVFTQQGLLITDFGCAMDSENGEIQESIGDMRYVSPERMAYYRAYSRQEQHPNSYPGKATDYWAAGLILLEIMGYDLPFNENIRMKERIKKSTPEFYQTTLHAIPELKAPSSGSIWELIQGLLQVEAKHRYGRKQIEKNTYFKTIDKGLLTKETREATFKSLIENQKDKQEADATESISNDNNENQEVYYYMNSPNIQYVGTRAFYYTTASSQDVSNDHNAQISDFLNRRVEAYTQDSDYIRTPIDKISPEADETEQATSRFSP